MSPLGRNDLLSVFTKHEGDPYATLRSAQDDVFFLREGVDLLSFYETRRRSLRFTAFRLRMMFVTKFRSGW